jgi:hypothetical protein
MLFDFIILLPEESGIVTSIFLFKFLDVDQKPRETGSEFEGKLEQNLEGTLKKHSCHLSMNCFVQDDRARRISCSNERHALLVHKLASNFLTKLTEERIHIPKYFF